MAITILGLGPGDASTLTRQAWGMLCAADEIYVRTAKHPMVGNLPQNLAVYSFDSLYESASDFETLYDSIADRVIELGRRPDGVLYAVPGHPLVAESTVQRILERAREEGLAVQVVDGLSFIEPSLTLLGLDGIDGLQLADAIQLAAGHYPALDPDRPALIAQLHSQHLASEIKLTLMSVYPDEHPVTLLRAAGTQHGSVTTISLYELDRDQRVDHLTTLYVPPLDHSGGMLALLDTVARLRAPGGCPWDREQTHESLRSSLLEETYEALFALDSGDMDKLCEELGDLLMQVAMHTQIAIEEEEFRFSDLVGGIDAKLKRRHPHVFGDLHVEDSGQVLRNWEAIKAAERSSTSEHGEPQSRLASVPAVLPALARAQALASRAAQSGLESPDVEVEPSGLCAKLAQVRGAVDQDARTREMGDLLFHCVNLARGMGVDAESALRNSCDRFAQAFAQKEKDARARGLDLGALPTTGRKER